MTDPALDRILVTGGTGFIGRYVVYLLVSDGFRPLITTYNEPPNCFLGIDPEELDLTDSAKTNELIATYRPRIVIHLAGTTGLGDPTGEMCQRMNYDATVNLLAALERADVDRVILIGSAAEYGDQPIPFREEMPCKPVSHYGKSKAMANEYALRVNAATSLPITILRIFTAYGYGQPDKMFLSQLITHALLSRHFMMSDGMQKRDFVYITDVAAAIKQAITAEGAVGRIINIGSGKGIRLKHLARTVWNFCGADSSLLNIGSKSKTGDDAIDTEADISLAEKLLNWRPTDNILGGTHAGFGLTETIDKMKNRSLPPENSN